MISSEKQTESSTQQVGLFGHPVFSPASSRLQTVAVHLSQFFLLAWLLLSIVNALQAALWFNGYPVNGPFQLYDPLRRLAAGQHIGRDFNFFHGIGVPALHYPLFWLFGAHSLVAAELSRQFTSLLLFCLTLGGFVWVTFRRPASRWQAAASLVLVLEVMFRGSAAPGHSLVSGRSALPIAAFALLQTRLSQTWKAALTGICIACAFLFGTEHGISLTLSLFAVGALSALQLLASRGNWQILVANIRFLAVALGTAVVSGALFLSALCGVGYVGRALHFNLVDLPANQFWLFGSPPMPYLHDWRQFYSDHHVLLCFLPTFCLLVLLAGLVFRTRRSPLTLGSDWRALAATMLVYACLTAIPMLGILSRHYTYPQARIFLLLCLLVIAHGGIGLFRRKASNTSAEAPLTNFKFPGMPRWPAIALSAAALLAGGAFLAQAASTGKQLIGHWGSHPAGYDRTLDDYWNTFMADSKRVIESHRTRPQTSLWSEYAALLDSRYGTLQTGEDYIIHSLSNRWPHYIQAFRTTNPEFVTMMTSQFSFDGWLKNERWEFYEEVLNNYRPLAEVEHASIWQRQPGPWIYPAQDFQQASLRSQAGLSAATLPALSGPGSVMVVRVHYQVINPWKKLPLLGGTPRYLAAVTGMPRDTDISFPPDKTEFQFPVKLVDGQPVTLTFKVDSLFPHLTFRVDAVEYKTLAAGPGVSTMFAKRIVPSRY